MYKCFVQANAGSWCEIDIEDINTKHAQQKLKH